MCKKSVVPVKPVIPVLCAQNAISVIKIAKGGKNRYL